MLFDFYKTSRKILGMNSRNLEYIRPFNLRRAKRIADDKILSKKILKKADIPVPKLLAKISSREELENFDWNSLPESFALKPNRGFGGEGIAVVYGKSKKKEGAWIKADRSYISIDDLKTHIQNILDGSFSLSGTPDIAFFEERLQLLKLFKPYAFKGIPDIRVIVFNKVPVMAMLRLPTKESHGKANLQQGAIGAGIDMATGITTSAISGKNKFIEKLPGSRLALSGLKIPHWKDILILAARAQEVSGLGFLGDDIAIDKERGPVILELNARPGLSIQLANLAGLKRRLERVAGLKIKTLEKGVRVGMDLFGGEIEEEVEEISGKKIIGAVEKVKLIGKNNKEIEVEARIDTGAQSSSIDLELAKELGFGEVLNTFEKLDLSEYEINLENESAIKKSFEQKYAPLLDGVSGVSVIFSASGLSLRPEVEVKFFLGNKEIGSRLNIARRGQLKYPMLVGRRDLKHFLVKT